MGEIEQLRAEILVLFKENRELRQLTETYLKRHLSVSEVARIYGYTQEEIRRLAIEEGKLRFIPVGKSKAVDYQRTKKKGAYQRIKFDRGMLEEDFSDLVITSPQRRNALVEKRKVQRVYVNPNKHRYL